MGAAQIREDGGFQQTSEESTFFSMKICKRASVQREKRTTKSHSLPSFFPEGIYKIVLSRSARIALSRLDSFPRSRVSAAKVNAFPEFAYLSSRSSVLALLTFSATFFDLARAAGAAAASFHHRRRRGPSAHRVSGEERMIGGHESVLRRRSESVGIPGGGGSAGVSGSLDDDVTAVAAAVNEALNNDVAAAAAGSGDDDAPSAAVGVHRRKPIVIVVTIVAVHYFVVVVVHGHANVDGVPRKSVQRSTVGIFGRDRVSDDRLSGGSGDTLVRLQGTGGGRRRCRRRRNGHGTDTHAVSGGGCCGAVVVIFVQRDDDRRMFVTLSEGVTMAHVDVKVRSASVLSWT